MEKYKKLILEHFKDPHNLKKMDNFSLKINVKNRFCSDDFTGYFLIKNNKIQDFSFEGTGCAFATASFSLISDHLKGKSLSNLKEEFNNDFLTHLFNIDITKLPFQKRTCLLLPQKMFEKIIIKEKNTSL